jgi:hypothetical protein
MSNPLLMQNDPNQVIEASICQCCHEISKKDNVTIRNNAIDYSIL